MGSGHGGDAPTQTCRLVLTVCPQIIPTNLRSSGFTICSIVAKFVVMTGPFVVDLVFMDTICTRILKIDSEIAEIIDAY